jgi:hypothetical protein
MFRLFADKRLASTALPDRAKLAVAGSDVEASVEILIDAEIKANLERDDAARAEANGSLAVHSAYLASP